MNILIFGKGYLGSSLYNSMKGNKKYKLIALASRNPEKPHLTSYQDGSRGETYCNTTAEPWVKHIYSLTKFDVIYHFAGNPSTRDDYYLDDISSTYNIARNAPRGSRIVYASSARVYGDYCLDCSESIAAAPTSLYAASKVASETLLNSYKGKIIAVNLRLSASIGKGMKQGIVYDIIQQLKSPSETVKLYGAKPGSFLKLMYTQDTVSVLEAAAASHHSGTFNVTTDTGLHAINIASIIMDYMNIHKPIQWVDGETIKMAPSNDKLQKSDMGDIECSSSAMALVRGIKDYLE